MAVGKGQEKIISGNDPHLTQPSPLLIYTSLEATFYGLRRMTPTDQLATFPLAMRRPAPETEIGRKCGQHFIFFDTTNLTIGFGETLFRQSQEVHTIE